MQNVAISCNHHAERKKADTPEYILMDSICLKCYETQKRKSEVAWGQGEGKNGFLPTKKPRSEGGKGQRSRGKF
jgi:hypothetical protein